MKSHKNAVFLVDLSVADVHGKGRQNLTVAGIGAHTNSDTVRRHVLRHNLVAPRQPKIQGVLKKLDILCQMAETGAPLMVYVVDATITSTTRKGSQLTQQKKATRFAALAPSGWAEWVKTRMTARLQDNTNVLVTVNKVTQVPALIRAPIINMGRRIAL